MGFILRLKDYMKDLVFYFEFTNDVEDEDTDHPDIYGFIVKNMTYNEIWDDIVVDFSSDMEELYGVHDWSSSPTKEVHGIGFTSYEVETKNHLELMEKWRHIFVNLAYNVSEVVKLDNSNFIDLDDYDIYKEIMRKI